MFFSYTFLFVFSQRLAWACVNREEFGRTRAEADRASSTTAEQRVIDANFSKRPNAGVTDTRKSHTELHGRWSRCNAGGTGR